jgi:hypothetical protein
MSHKHNFPLAIAMSLFLMGVATSANAVVVFTVTQVGQSIAVYGVGSLVTIGLAGTEQSTLPQLNSTRGTITVGDPSTSLAFAMSFAGANAFGPGPIVADIFSSVGSGDVFGLNPHDSQMKVPFGYVSGATLDGVAVFKDRSLEELGFVVGQYATTYSYDVDGITYSDAFLTNVLPPYTIPPLVPEPQTLVLLLSGLFVLCSLSRAKAYPAFPTGA